MHELDLIPDDYRRLCSVRYGLKRFGLICVLLLLIVITSKVILNKKMAGITDKIALLEEQQQVVNQQEKEMAELLKIRSVKEKQLQFINTLEQGGGVTQIFLVLDRVMDNSVWFSRWQYQAAELIEVAKDDVDSTNAEPMKIKIIGQALDNTALSIFVEKLMAQPEIQDVKVNSTTMISRDASTINFDMDIR